MKYLLPICAAICTIVLAPHIAQASSYSTSSGKTLIEFKELPGTTLIGGSIGEGRYTTTIGTQQWMGAFTATTVTNTGTTRTYSGTFGDRLLGPGANQGCKGSIKLQRPISNSGPAPLKVTWTMGPGGINCPSPVGTPSTLNLTEALPVANGSGDFLASNSNPRPSETNGQGTWPRWKVVDLDPRGLNCRATNGDPATTYSTGAIITAQARFNPNAFVTVGGDSWLSVRFSQSQYCFVRANTSYIKPTLMPF